MDIHDKMIQLQKQLHQITVDHWIKEVVFSFHWWVMLLAVIGWCIVWWKLVDRKRLMEILLYGFFVCVLSTFADVLGWNFVQWTYDHTLLPICTPILAMDIVIIPMTYMLIYQYFTKWTSFFIAHVILAVVFAFIGENILEWLEFYHPLNWEHFYSFPGYIVMALFFKWLINKIKQTQNS